MPCALAIDRIRLDFQPEVNLIDDTVADYVEKMHRAVPIEPVTVRYDGRQYWLQDGFHRVAAARQLGRHEIDAEVIPGTLQDMEREWRLAAIRRDLR